MTIHAEGARSQTKEKSVDEMLDRKGFAEFLAELKEERGEEGETSERLIKEGFEIFERYEKVSEGVKKLYNEQLKEELGINLNDAAKEALDKHLRKEVLEKPNALKRLESLLSKHKEQAARVRELEQSWKVRIKGGQDRDAFKSDAEHVQTLRKKVWGGLGHFISEDFRQSREALRARYNFDGKADQAVRDGIGMVAEARLALLDARQSLLATMLKDEAVATAVAESAKAKLQSLAGGSFDDMSKSGKMLRSMRELAGRVGVSEEFLPDEDELTEEMDEQIEEQAKVRLTEALETAEGGEKNRFSNLEKTLKAFLTANALGSKEGDEAREFVETTIEEKLEDEDLSPVQRIFLERVQQKLKNNAYTA